MCFLFQIKGQTLASLVQVGRIKFIVLEVQDHVDVGVNEVKKVCHIGRCTSRFEIDGEIQIMILRHD